MEFLKNIDKPFLLKPSFNLLKETRGFESDIPQGDIFIELIYLDLDGGQFSVIEFPDVDKFVDETIVGFINELTNSVNEVKVIAKKVIKAWEDNPDGFVKQTGRHSNDTYINKTLLTDDEYHKNVYVRIDKLRYSYDELSFTTGCGGDTHYNKAYYEKGLANIDGWLVEQLKTLGTSKIKKRITNYINKTAFSLGFDEIIEHVGIINGESSKKKNKVLPPFPMELSADTLNSLLYENDDGPIDSGFIKFFKDEYDIDLSLLEDWEIRTSTDGEHHNDGQICDYTVEFTSLDGDSYYTYNSHCLMTGWNFYGKVEI